MILTLDQILICCPTAPNPQDLLNAVNKYLPAYGITTVNEVAGFLAECGHESVDFSKLEENLNYSAKALGTTWPKRFPDAETQKAYARKPEKIANKVYASRMGNGDESSGDGWKYRGRGAIQLTGHDNYQLFATYRGVDINALGSYLTTIDGAIDSACWYWITNQINISADADDVVGMTKKINIGLIGEDDRELRYARCKEALS